MDRTSAASTLVLAAVFLLSTLASFPPEATAQVGTSSLAGSVCSIDQVVYYIKAPEPGETGGCGISLADAKLHLTKAGVGSTPVGAVDKTATSDGNGTFQFANLPDGDYSLNVARAGYDAVTLNVTVSGATARNVGLHPKIVVVSGRVVDTSGAGVPYAHVTACCGPTVGGTDASADQAGSFQLKTESGEREFAVDKDGVRVLSETRFVDGTKPVTLTIQPPPRPDAVLHGTVTDQDGRPLAKLPISIYSYGNCCYTCCYDAPQPYTETQASTGTATSSATASPTTTSAGGSSGAGTSYARPCCYGGGNTTTTDSAGRYSMRLYGGSSVSVSASRDGYASYSKSFQMAQGEDRLLDIQLLKFPAKTAHIEGKVVDAGSGKGLPYVSVSAQSPAYGLYECSQDSGAGSTQTGTSAPPATPTTEPAPNGDSGTAGTTTSQGIAYPYPAPYDNGCAIRVNPDGTFSGDVTPGYTILQVSYDSYRACQPYDGSAYKPCTPEYYIWSRSLRLDADATTPVDVRLEQRPGPDAVVSGYLVDADTGKAIPNGQVSFSSEDGYGYGGATTDQDGSYRIKIRSGHLDVYASAEGHLHWVGTITIESGETPFDIQLVPGEESNGGCCMMYAGEKAVAYGGATTTYSTTASMTRTQASQPARDSGGSPGAGAAFEDLHGGLGPYNAAARSHAASNATGGHASPAAGVLVLAALLGCAAWAVRRRLP
jgi:hypothetical protein